MEPITKDDLSLIVDLSSRTYHDNKLLSNATDKEKNHLGQIIKKLKNLSDYFSLKYNTPYGPFVTSVTTGNPIAIGGKKFKRIWSGIFKGASNKQYAAQVSFVMNPYELCLDVGFYFGSASGHSLGRDQRIESEQKLRELGVKLSNTIINNVDIHEKYNKLIDFGFKTFAGGRAVLADDWFNIIKTQTKNAHIIAKIFPNDFDIIEYSTIDSFISQVIFLMSGITEGILEPIIIKPLTPEQRAKQAERFAEIGLKGELYVLEYEKKRLDQLGFKNLDYPKHIALDSMAYGYDILSIDESKNEIYIEVKTTVRNREDLASRSFFISMNEIQVFTKNKKKYKLYRVYDVENNPSIEVLDLEKLAKKPDGYIIEY